MIYIFWTIFVYHVSLIIYGINAYVQIDEFTFSMKDYENLALNVAEIKRYLNQQREIILYYEKAVTEDSQ